MIRLSVVIITFNEARNIFRCLDSVKKIADEIIVVDSGSVDDTREIATAAGAKVIHHPFEGHISQKTFAVSCAGFEHILSIDADEALSAELESSILDIKENWKYDCYKFNRLTNYCGKWIRHGGWYPDRKLRLFKRDSGQWGGDNPHDRFIPKPQSTIGFLKGNLLHYSYYSVEEHISQINRFTTIAAKGEFEKGRRAGLFHMLIKPQVRFLRDYIFHLGILDGFHGLLIAHLSAGATYLKYVKLKQMWKKK